MHMPVDDLRDKPRKHADIPARDFKVDIEAPRGHRFSYRVVPAEHGKLMVDFELAGRPATQVVE